MAPGSAPNTAGPSGEYATMPNPPDSNNSTRYQDTDPATAQPRTLPGIHQPDRGTHRRRTSHWAVPAKAPPSAWAPIIAGTVTGAGPAASSTAPLAWFTPQLAAKPPRSRPTPLANTHQPARENRRRRMSHWRMPGRASWAAYSAT